MPVAEVAQLLQCAPRLKGLVASMAACSAEELRDLAHIAAAGDQALTELYIRQFQQPDTLRDMPPFALSGVRKLTLGDPPADGFALAASWLCATLPGLQELRLRCYDDTIMDDALAQVFALPRLEVVRIKFKMQDRARIESFDLKPCEAISRIVRFAVAHAAPGQRVHVKVAPRLLSIDELCGLISIAAQSVEVVAFQVLGDEWAF